MKNARPFLALVAGLLVIAAAWAQQAGQVTVLSPDRRLVVTVIDRAISISDAQTQQERIRLQGHSGAVSALAI